MKRFLIITLFVFGALAAAAGCTALEPCPEAQRTPILFETREDDSLSVQTRSMTERTSAAGFTCLAVNASGTTVVSNVKTTTSGSRQELSGKYWPSSGTLSFYGVLPNTNMSNSSGTVILTVGSSLSPLDGTEDYIVASKKNVANATSPVSMSFSHILAHIEGVTLTGSVDGATTTVRSISFSRPTSGVYNMSTGAWTNKLGSQTTSLSRPGSISGTGTGSAASDLSVIPGTYTLSVTYTVSMGGVSETYTRTGSFTLTAGKRHTITATLSDSFQDLSVGVSVSLWSASTAWTENFISNG